MNERTAKIRGPADQTQIYIRKRFLGATFVTCVVLSIVFGTVHVLELGNNRMLQMREKAAYDLSEMDNKVRAAGEDLYRTDEHERRITHNVTYTSDEADGLLSLNEWKKVEERVLIPAGSFTMGTDSLKSDAHNRPAHQVYLDAYEIDKYPVTNAQYARFVAATNYRPPINWPQGKIPPGKELHPVTMVAWTDATAYAKWAGKRLPSEAEWEKAARGGEDDRRWPWGDVMDPTKLNTYYTVGNTTPIGSFPKGISPYGVHDLSGNVQEWVENDFLPYKGSSASEEIFKGKIAVASTDRKSASKKVADFVETDERYKVMRGGSWKSDPFSTSVFHRNFSMPNFTSDFFGFRTVKDIKKSHASAK
ncbi:MAG: formylglycine-generating enzyme family protein [Gammaproteobacteria bacterium]|nr:formylglycine-generating enzyme family protein [Gammaproteobacteria bacterium]